MDSNDGGCDDFIVSNHDNSRNIVPADALGNLDVEEPPKKRARKDSKPNPPRDGYATAYAGWTYESLQFAWTRVDPSNTAASLQYLPRQLKDEAPPPPCTPLRYFQASYRALPPPSGATITAEMIVHQHRNGLCVVTVANGAALWPHLSDPASSLLWRYEVAATPADWSRGQTRKRHAKLLSSLANEVGVVTPHHALATLRVVVADATVVDISFPAAVLGSVLELNRAHEQTTSRAAWHRLLVADAHATGYLAVILPAGPVPPRCRGGSSVEEATNHNMARHKENETRRK
jgi:hypothetical protein